VQIRQREADIEMHITPVEEQYHLLLRYDVRATRACLLLRSPSSVTQLLSSRRPFSRR
jgi:hypothetical protein